ncbi:hypothetical protein JL108_08660 [Aeromicrobium sp. YIM 150415]|uniref:hypothetical protein n=1 Tax=Aeromicrobium sp. YIM 150415 TaxID=2803912 RepID=UPI001966B7A5|nr:hypothetical protein [Aeromicrobium sp. YIM 150415]MBM9463521.1 hypothetical protein [Aeromicrobium sp. YIM 150415]
MDYRTFAEAYRPETAGNPWAGTDFVPSELVEMHELLGRFGRLLHSRLAEGVPADAAAYAQFSTFYVNRALELEPIIHQHHQATLGSALQEPDAGTGSDRGERAMHDYLNDSRNDVSGVHRHLDAETLLTVEPQHYARVLTGGIWAVQMFGHTQSQWYQALTGRPIHQDSWLRSQIGLANNASTMAWQRDQLYEAGVLYLPEAESLRLTLTGSLAEADALITLLGVARGEPGLTVIPAPPQFEAYAGAANADFLVLDLRREQIIGVQVKSSEAYRAREHYDPDRIILIDASLDLFGTLSRRTRLGHSDSSTRSWPGQVTGHFLDSIQIPRPPWPWLNMQEFTASRRRVQNVVAEARDRNHEAEEIVRERVLTALGR